MPYKRLNEISKRTFKRRYPFSQTNDHLLMEHQVSDNEVSVDSITCIEQEPSDNIESAVSNTEPNLSNNESVINDVDSVTDQILSESESDDETPHFDLINKTDQYEDYASFLVNWKFSNNVTNTALNELLTFLKNNGHLQLPKDSRTLLETPKKHIIHDVTPGKYIHIGLKNSLENILKNRNCNDLDEIILDFNIDGVPISKSSNSGFWMILFKVYNIRDAPVSTVGIYHGYKKPQCFSDFIRPHIIELKELLAHFSFNGKIIKIKVRAYICDAPAKALLSGIKGHTGYFGCSKCCQEGIFINSRMTFPELSASPRTNNSFREKHDENHHKFTSILEELDIDMVKQIPLDYLHVILLGVVKKLIRMWLNGNLKNRLPSIGVKQINHKLLTMASTQPMEFQRKIRSLDDFGYFKASELRTFLLYSGPVALKDILPPENYHHFLLLHISVRMLCDKHMHKTHLQISKKMLQSFIVNMADLYGDEHIVYNVHSLIHITDEVEKFGCLDEFSSFPFESYMFQIKRLLHKNCQPLTEIANRIMEMNNASYTKNTRAQIKYPLLKKKQNVNGEIIYGEIVLKGFTLNCKPSNQWFLTKTNKVVKFKYARIINDKIIIYCNKVKNTYDFYNTPVKSTALHIYASCGSVEDLHSRLNIADIFMKLFCIENHTDKNLFFFPLLHTN